MPLSCSWFDVLDRFMWLILAEVRRIGGASDQTRVCCRGLCSDCSAVAISPGPGQFAGRRRGRGTRPGL